MSDNAGLDTRLDTGLDAVLDADNAGLDAENVGQ